MNENSKLFFPVIRYDFYERARPVQYRNKVFRSHLPLGEHAASAVPQLGEPATSAVPLTVQMRFTVIMRFLHNFRELNMSAIDCPKS